MTLPPPLPISTKYKNHHKQIDNYVQNYFKSNHPNKDIKSTKNDKLKQNNLSTINCPSNINNNLTIPSDNYSTLNNTIQQYEISSIIKKLDPYKAYGPDRIHNQMIKHFGPKVIQNITLLYNKCMKNGCFPTIWNEAHVLPIPKPMKDHSNPKNYRPIAISSCLGRVLEKILANRLQHYCIDNKIFNNFQCGFQLNRCCDDFYYNRN